MIKYVAAAAAATSLNGVRACMYACMNGQPKRKTHTPVVDCTWFGLSSIMIILMNMSMQHTADVSLFGYTNFINVICNGFVF